MALQLTVLGSAGSHTGVGRLCSGYLVQAGGTSILLDAGNGSTANLQRYLPIHELDAVVISHRHLDHCVDLIGCFYALRFDPSFDGRIPLHAAPEVHEALTGMLSTDSAMSFDEVYDHRQVDHGDHVEVGALALSFVRNIHPPPTVATRIEVAGKVLVYSADTAGGDALVEHARGADLFLCEATWTGDAADWPPGVHLTARDAGIVATRAEVGRLVLTHIAGGTDRAQVLREAGETFGGPIELAEDLATYLVD